MKNIRLWASSILGGLLLTTAPQSIAQVKIGVISATTGSSAFVGIPQKNSVELLPRKVGDLTIDYVVFDDASDPTQSVQNVKRLLTEHKVDALIGPSGSPSGFAVTPFVSEAQTPMLAPIGNSALIRPVDDKKRWVFITHPNDDIIAEGLVDAMVKRGVRTLGFIGYNDPYGENWYNTFSPMAEKAGIRIVANERFARQDTSVSGQAIKLIAARPDAVLVAAVAAGAALPHTQLVDSGYKGTVYHTHGSASGAFIQIGGKKVEGALIVGPYLAVSGDVPSDVVSRSTMLDYVHAYQKQFRSRPPIFGAGVHDAGLLLERALPLAAQKAKPGTVEFRRALRDALEETKGLVTAQGIVSMTSQDHSGYDHRGRTLLTVNNGAFELVKD